MNPLSKVQKTVSKEAPKAQTPPDTFSYDDLKSMLLGEKGSNDRVKEEAKAKAYVIGQRIRKIREEKRMTQEQLAEKINAKKGFISRIENGYVDPQLSTLYRIFEHGLGCTLSLQLCSE